MKPKTISPSELAAELNVSRPLVSKWIRSGLLRARRDGRLNRSEVFTSLRLYWTPSHSWFERPVPADGMGAQLREAWAREAEESGTAADLRELLADLGILENDAALPEITED